VGTCCWNFEKLLGRISEVLSSSLSSMIIFLALLSSLVAFESDWEGVSSFIYSSLQVREVWVNFPDICSNCFSDYWSDESILILFDCLGGPWYFVLDESLEWNWISVLWELEDFWFSICQHFSKVPWLSPDVVYFSILRGVLDSACPKLEPTSLLFFSDSIGFSSRNF